MPPLPNQRHERFAQEIAKGKTADEAYQLAGYAENRGNASRLKSNEIIAARVAELLGRGAAKAEITVQSLIDDAEKIMKAAMEANQFGAAVAALKEKGVLSGKRIEKRETGGPGDFERMSDDELRDFITSRVDRDGESDQRTGTAH